MGHSRQPFVLKLVELVARGFRDGEIILILLAPGQSRWGH